jgi:hypothetical protein
LTKMISSPSSINDEDGDEAEMGEVTGADDGEREYMYPPESKSMRQG